MSDCCSWRNIEHEQAPLPQKLIYGHRACSMAIAHIVIEQMRCHSPGLQNAMSMAIKQVLWFTQHHPWPSNKLYFNDNKTLSVAIENKILHVIKQILFHEYITNLLTNTNAPRPWNMFFGHRPCCMSSASIEHGQWPESMFRGMKHVLRPSDMFDRYKNMRIYQILRSLKSVTKQVMA